MLKEYFKGQKGAYTENKSDWIIELRNGSSIWLAGFDDSDRTEKVMGQEYATIFVNESTQITYQTFQMLKTRLNFMNIDLKFILDCNPRAPSHWLHRIFVQHQEPEKLGPLPRKDLYTRLMFIPEDNKANLADGYIENNLETMTGIKKKRLRSGIWCDNDEGCVYKFSRDVNHRQKPYTYHNGVETHTGWDFGIAADVFIVWAQFFYFPPTETNKLGLEIRIFDECVNNNKDYKYYANIVKEKPYINVQHTGDTAGKSRESDLKSWFIRLKEEGITLQHPPRHTVADMIDNTNKYMPYIRISELQCPKMVECLENWSFPKDKDDKVIEGSLPEHDQYSHPGTALYYMIAKALPIKGNSWGAAVH